VPGVSAFAGPRILERFELQTRFGEPYLSTIGEQPLAIRRDEMRHEAVFPAVAVQPQPTVHCVDHSVTAMIELSVRQR
jgi:hypothetical protein